MHAQLVSAAIYRKYAISPFKTLILFRKRKSLFLFRLKSFFCAILICW